MSSIKKLWAWVRSKLQFRVKRWTVGRRGWAEEDIRLCIGLEDNIWYWVLAEWLVWDIGTYICHYSDFVKVPKFIRNWKRVWDKEEEACTFEEWYGDSIHSIVHCNICSPLCQWVWSHKSLNEPQWELTLAEAREKFAHDPKVFRWIEEDIEEHKKYDAEKAAEEAKKLAENTQ